MSAMCLVGLWSVTADQALAIRVGCAARCASSVTLGSLFRSVRSSGCWAVRAPVEVGGDQLAVGVFQFQLDEVHGGEGGRELDRAEGGGRRARRVTVVSLLEATRAVEVVDGHVRNRVGERFGQVVDHLQLAIGLVELDVLHLAGVLDAKSEAFGSRS